jgi:hypothetical protein
MHYQTRHLEALADFAHGQTQVRKGDRFPASEIDAKFYVDRGRARDVTEEQAAAAAAAAARPATASIGAPERPVKRASPPPEHARPAAKRAANATGARTRGFADDRCRGAPGRRDAGRRRQHGRPTAAPRARTASLTCRRPKASTCASRRSA